MVEGQSRRNSTAPFPTSPASSSRPIPKAASAPPPTIAPTPMPPTWWRARSSRTADTSIYRGFVYDHHMDWRNPKNDRARAAYDNFQDARRPVRRQRHHPDQERPHRFPGARARLAALRRAGENQPGHRTAGHPGVHGTGAAHRLSGPQWKETLDFDMHAAATPTPVKALLAGKTLPPARRRLRRRGQRGARRKLVRAINCRRPISTASAGSRGIPI